MSNKKPYTVLFAIDPQMDFCSPGVNNIGDDRLLYKGSLFVPGADEDMIRAAEFIRKNIPHIDRIFVTLDSHHPWSIFHPCFWVDEKGVNADPYTQITAQEVMDGKWRPSQAGAYKEALAYLEALEAKGKFKLMVWPPHCLIASTGATVFAPLHDAIHEWEYKHPQNCHYEVKGTSVMTEAYSALRAEVPRTDEPWTQLNTAFIHRLSVADRIFVIGEALSHCVRETMKDVFDNLPNHLLPKIYIFEDCMSSVQGFEDAGRAFLDDARSRGVNVMKSTDFVF